MRSQNTVEFSFNEQTDASSDLEDSLPVGIDSKPPVSSSLQVVSKGPLNVERNLKKILRLLRKSLKRQFDEVHNKKHYYWSGENLRRRTMIFFTEQCA